MSWYVLFVETGKEEIVQHFLRVEFDNLILTSIIPRRKVPEKKGGMIQHVLKKMFPGYVLIQTEMNENIFYRIKKAPHVYRLVNGGEYFTKCEGIYFSKIFEEEIDLLLRLLGDGEIIDYSKVYIKNSVVQVISGPLKGLEGMIAKLDSHKNRAKIRFNLMGTEKLMDVGVEVIYSPIKSNISS